MIEKANINDLKIVVDIMEEIKEEMRRENNPQWGSDESNYPSEEVLLDDITNELMYKYVENDVIKGIITVKDDDGEYEELIENSSKKSYIIHRLGIPKKYRKNGIATKLMNFIEEKGRKEQVKVLKSDTEICNDKMNRLFIKLGYKYKGIFNYTDYPGNYNYYEKEI